MARVQDKTGNDGVVGVYIKDRDVSHVRNVFKVGMSRFQDGDLSMKVKRTPWPV
jgi:hypothetical protein